jgi:Holliday junction resolvasome RuvABC endonuclease subunit
MSLKILGFDASTSTIGYGLIECDDDYRNLKLLDSGWWKPNKNLGVFEKLLEVKGWVEELLIKSDADVISIEDFILFMKGFSSAKVISTLAILNRTVGLTVLATTGKVPVLLPVLSIRHAIKKDGTVPSKEEVPARLEEILRCSPIVKFKKTRSGIDKAIEESYDEADGIAVAVAYSIKAMNGTLKTTTLKKKSKRRKS